MSQPNYVLAFSEERMSPVNPGSICYPLRTVAFAVPILALVGTILVGENLFVKFGLSAWLLYLVGTFKICSMCKTVDLPSPMEIQFFDDYLIAYCPKRYYDRKVTRKEINKYFYSEIKEIRYRTHLRKFFIVGMVESTWYNYTKQGIPTQNPTFHKTLDAGTYFFIVPEETRDIAAEIEAHCPIKVTHLDH